MNTSNQHERTVATVRSEWKKKQLIKNKNKVLHFTSHKTVNVGELQNLPVLYYAYIRIYVSLIDC